MYKLAFISESDSVLAFQAVGFDTFMVSPQDAPGVLEAQYKTGKYAVIFLSENLVESVEALLEEYAKSPMPAICILPAGRELQNVGLNRMKKICIRATGTDIISKL